jgi:hypothetical protein
MGRLRHDSRSTDGAQYRGLARNRSGDRAAAAQSSEENVSVATGTAMGVAMLIGVAALEAQEVTIGPTIVTARAAFFVSAPEEHESVRIPDTNTPCGSPLKNAAMLGLGLSLAVGVIELTYTIIREPFVRNGRDLPRADPKLIAWAGGAGFAIGLIGTEVCRRRRR